MDKKVEVLLKISEETLKNVSEPKRRLIQFLQEIYADSRGDAQD